MFYGASMENEYQRFGRQVEKLCTSMRLEAIWLR